MNRRSRQIQHSWKCLGPTDRMTVIDVRWDRSTSRCKNTQFHEGPSWKGLNITTWWNRELSDWFLWQTQSKDTGARSITASLLEFTIRSLLWNSTDSRRSSDAKTKTRRTREETSSTTGFQRSSYKKGLEERSDGNVVINVQYEITQKKLCITLDQCPKVLIPNPRSQRLPKWDDAALDTRTKFCRLNRVVGIQTEAQMWVSQQTDEGFTSRRSCDRPRHTLFLWLANVTVSTSTTYVSLKTKS